MAYSIKYTVDFTDYQLRISQKDYAGAVTSIGAGNPAVIHAWDKDEPTAAIKGSSLTASIFGVPLIEFYANNDDEYKGELFKGTQNVFSGFLVQDDCNEDVDDLDHVVTLSFTDNLGLLKDVSLGEALDAIAVTASKISLTTILHACLQATGVQIPKEIFAALKEDSQNTASSFFDQTLIAKESFLKSEREYDNCYDVLEKIMVAFNATLVQANGQWNIIRWFERAPGSFKYDDFFFLLGTGTYNNFKASGFNQYTYPEYGYNKRIVRPYKVVKETFNYQLPHQILKNADLKDLGNLIRTYSSGDNTVKEYEFPYWFDSDLAVQTADYFIRVVTDNVDNEIERYIVVKSDAIMSTSIEGNEGDVINFSFNVRTGVSVPLPANLVFVVRVSDGTNTKYADEDGFTWKNTTGYAKTFNSDLTQWQNVDIKTGRLPFSGLVTVFLTLSTPSALDETHYNDLNFKYTAYINESTRIIGQTHTNTQDIDVKNKDEYDINIDDSPRNFVSGTLFLNSLTGVLQNRTSSWSTPTLSATTPHTCKLCHFQVFGPTDPYTIRGKYCDGTDIIINGIGSGDNPAPICARVETLTYTGCELVNQTDDCGSYLPDVPKLRLGEITTKEIKQWRSRPRTILEGNLYGDVSVSPMTTFTNPAFPDLNFIPGKMEIDYGNNKCTGTLHELYETGAPIIDSEYKFEYIYDSK